MTMTTTYHVRTDRTLYALDVAYRWAKRDGFDRPDCRAVDYRNGYTVITVTEKENN